MKILFLFLIYFVFCQEESSFLQLDLENQSKFSKVNFVKKISDIGQKEIKDYPFINDKTQIIDHIPFSAPQRIFQTMPETEVNVKISDISSLMYKKNQIKGIETPFFMRQPQPEDYNQQQNSYNQQLNNQENKNQILNKNDTIENITKIIEQVTNLNQMTQIIQQNDTQNNTIQQDQQQQIQEQQEIKISDKNEDIDQVKNKLSDLQLLVKKAINSSKIPKQFLKIQGDKRLNDVKMASNILKKLDKIELQLQQDFDLLYNPRFKQIEHQEIHQNITENIKQQEIIKQNITPKLDSFQAQMLQQNENLQNLLKNLIKTQETKPVNIPVPNQSSIYQEKFVPNKYHQPRFILSF